MFGWLVFDETNGRNEIAAAVPGWDLPALPLANQAETAERMNRVMAFLEANCPKAPGDTGDVRDRVFFAMRDLAAWLPQEHLDFAMFMVLAHHRLPQEDRLARERPAPRFVDDQFAELGVLPGDRKAQLERLKKLAILIPDALQETSLRTICARLRLEWSMGANALPAYGDLGAWCHQLGHLVMQTRPAQAVDLASALIRVMLHCPAVDRLRFRTLITQLLKTDQWEAMLQVLARDSGAPQPLPGCLLCDALAWTIDSVASGPGTRTVDELVDEALAPARARNAANQDRVLRSSIAAVRAGVAMGARTQESLAALERVQQCAAEVRLRMTPQRLNEARQARAVAGPVAAPDQEKQDLDPVYSWSIDRLVQWIEGPLFSKTPPQPIDRQRIVSREQPARDPARVAPPPPSITVKDVGNMLDDALSATARFFLDDINDLVPRAKSLNTPLALVNACVQLRAALGALANPRDAVVELKARALLTDAESRIDRLRQGIKAAQVAEQTQQRFSNHLDAALFAEPMVLGKRHGGVIHCPMPPEAWPWVAASFHRRWLPQLRRVTIDGTGLPLADDQALALYVTGSSLSQYAFDVSVHLWRRIPGRTCLPSQGFGVHPPMNEKDWFDTYIPCSVLHVPALV